jgi:hypothetical protein
VSQVTVDGRTFCSRLGLVDVVKPPKHTRIERTAELAGQSRRLLLRIGEGWYITHGRDEPPLAEHPDWLVERLAVDLSYDGRTLALRQRCPPADGLGYAYHKSYRVDAEQRALTIDYAMTNLGDRPLKLVQFNHNYLRLDSDGPIDRRYAIETLMPLARPARPWLTQQANGYRPKDEVTTPIYCKPAGASPAELNRLVLRHDTTGRRVEMTGDFAPADFALYAEAQAMCPEVFIDLELAPGQSRRWQRVYRFTVEMQ